MAKRSNFRFHYSAYWRKWSLVLTTNWAVRHANGEKPMGHSTVEIDLEPIHGWGFTDECDKKVRALNLRVHCTAPGHNDVFAEELPIEIEAALMAQIGPDLAAWLLDPTTEILGLVDWEAYRALNNGGASLREIAHGKFAHLIPTEHSSEAMGRLADFAKAA